MKHRKVETYVYEINDDQGHHHTGFSEAAVVLHNYYYNVLGPSNVNRSPLNPQTIQKGITLTVESQLQLCKPFSEKDIRDALFSIPNLKSLGPDGYNNDVMIFTKAHPPTLHIIILQANHTKSRIVFAGCSPHLQLSYLQITGFQEGHLPLSYLGVPITASTLSKMECRALVEKIISQIKGTNTETMEPPHLVKGHSSKALFHYLAIFSAKGTCQIKHSKIHRPNSPNLEAFLTALKKLKGPRQKKRITYAVVAAAIYHIWRVRNTQLFDHKLLPACIVFGNIRELIIQRALFLNRLFRKLDSYELDWTLNNLSGEIPKFLAALPLQMLNLSYNNFKREVPIGGVFSNETELSIVILLVAFILVCAFCLRKRRNEPGGESDMLLPSLSYKDILKVTNEFPLENLIRSGTFEVVYKAILDQGRTLGYLYAISHWQCHQ
ncbi:hypothetical protein Cgig2_017732 [Carnegiea gigantea]|uniref:Uncharacterized protein n=1 Tax=Carnegiea gigantea TaxID=171969 RepID=A0A9Q1JLI3_9CARY|nr:hypothetical protein Cgig2_017732 [Carnegiea gigantea]